MQRLGQRGPEVPVVEGAAQIGAGVPLHGMVQVGELQGIAQEEYGRVVAHEIPVAFLGIELHREAPDIALGVGSAALAGHRGKAEEEFGLLAHFGENLRLGVAGDIVGDGEGAVSAGTLGVHAPLGYHLPVEVGELFQEPDILQQHRAAWPAVMVFWLSTTGAPFLVVSFFFFMFPPFCAKRNFLVFLV